MYGYLLNSCSVERCRHQRSETLCVGSDKKAQGIVRQDETVDQIRRDVNVAVNVAKGQFLQ